MSLENNVNEAIKEAMKAKAEGALRGLRGIKAAILLAKTEKGAVGELNAEREILLLQKMFKQRKESYDIFIMQGREDLASKELEEMEVIEKYLPKQIDDAELNNAIKELIAENDISSMKDMGKLMGMANKKLAGKADSQRISVMVKLLLNS